MPENHFNFSRANAVRPKDVGVGGLAGSTNGFTPATPLNLSKIRKSRTNWGEGPLSYQTCYYTTRLYSSAWWFLFVCLGWLHKLACFCQSVRKDSVSHRKAIFTTQSLAAWLRRHLAFVFLFMWGL